MASGSSKSSKPPKPSKNPKPSEPSEPTLPPEPRDLLREEAESVFVLKQCLQHVNKCCTLLRYITPQLVIKDGSKELIADLGVRIDALVKICDEKTPQPRVAFVGKEFRPPKPKPRL